MFIHLLFLIALTLISLCCYACHGRAYVGGNWPWHHYHHSRTTRRSRSTSRNNRPCLMPHSSTRPLPVPQLSLMHLPQQARSKPIHALARPLLRSSWRLRCISSGDHRQRPPL